LAGREKIGRVDGVTDTFISGLKEAPKGHKATLHGLALSPQKVDNALKRVGSGLCQFAIIYGERFLL
jgi:hypothetical protein